ncbi:MAG: RNA methyltransferase [Bacteroidales bacterium]|nr:RNA methyltransferase [Bacteroidales bacterium]
MDTGFNQEFYDFLSGFLTDNRKQLFEKIIQFRTRHLTVVLEDIYQPHNASAVLRSADLTGVQDIHIIENKNRYHVNPQVAMGSSKWLNLIHYNEKEDNTMTAYNALHAKGYKIVAATPHSHGKSLDELQLDNKLAIVFGTELKGLTQKAIDNADEYLWIPMYGFTESYNISVSAALTLFTLTEKLRKSDINWQLTEFEKKEILLEWTRRSVARSDVFEREFFLRKNKTF